MTAQVEAIETEYTPSSALHPVTINELVSMELPERQRFLPWLVEGGLVMVFGPRGVGKTYFSIGLAAASSSCLSADTVGSSGIPFGFVFVVPDHFSDR